MVKNKYNTIDRNDFSLGQVPVSTGVGTWTAGDVMFKQENILTVPGDYDDLHAACAYVQTLRDANDDTRWIIYYTNIDPENDPGDTTPLVVPTYTTISGPTPGLNYTLSTSDAYLKMGQFGTRDAPMITLGYGSTLVNLAIYVYALSTNVAILFGNSCSLINCTVNGVAEDASQPFIQFGSSARIVNSIISVQQASSAVRLSTNANIINARITPATGTQYALRLGGTTYIQNSLFTSNGSTLWAGGSTFDPLYVSTCYSYNSGPYEGTYVINVLETPFANSLKDYSGDWSAGQAIVATGSNGEFAAGNIDPQYIDWTLVPTSAGASGTLWNDTGTLKIVP